MRSPSLFGYQEQGARWLADSEPNKLLLMEAGLGKTPTAVRGCDLVKAERVLVVCPAVVRPHWINEFHSWQHQPRSLPKRVDGSDRLADVCVVSYDQISRGLVNFGEVDVLILDEAQYLKNWRSKRTRRIYGIGKAASVVAQAKRVWALSGTISPNGPHEMWTHLRALFPAACVLNEKQFISRYCLTRETIYGIQIVGVREDHIAELRRTIRAVSMQRRKVDVLKDLPPLRFATVTLDVEHHPTAEQDAHLVRAIESLDAGALLDASAQLELSSMRRELGIAKAPAVVCLLDEELRADTTSKVVVFAHHRAVIEALREGLADYLPCVLHGATSADQRVAAIDRFQNDPTARVFIGQIQAAGTGITLTAAANVVFAEASWVPAENVQAACRCHRIGQNADRVLARFVCIAGSLDEGIARVLARKSAALDALWQVDAGPPPPPPPPSQLKLENV